MEKMDERQQQVRGIIMRNIVVANIIVLMAVALIHDFGIVNILAWMSLGDLLICIVILEITYGSVALLIKDAYFGLCSMDMMKRLLYVFTTLAIFEIALTCYDIVRGEMLSVISLCSILMVCSITACMWYKKKDW